MSSMLNISARRENLNVSPSVVNNVNVNADFSKLNKIPTKLTRTKSRAILPRELTEAAQEAAKTDETIKIIHQDGSASVYIEPTPYEAITEDTTEQVDAAYTEQQAEQQTQQQTQQQTEQQTIKSSISNEVDVLTQYIKLLREHNIVKAEKFVLNADELANIVLLITQADEVNVSLNQDIGCVSIGKKKQVDNIYIIKDNTRNDFKLFYPSEYAYLRDLRIDLKNVIIS